MKIPEVILIIMIVAALFMFGEDRRKARHIPVLEENVKEELNTAEDDPQEEEENIEDAGTEEESLAEAEDKEVEEKESGQQGGPGNARPSSERPKPGSSSQGGQGSGTSPAYEYFMEGGKYICKGCYLPFGSLKELNAHVCTGHTEESCSHEWVAEYHDVWVEEKGHYENGLISAAWDEAVYGERCVCKVCGAQLLTSEEAADHIISVHGNEGSWEVVSVVTSYIHHDAVYGDVYVRDEEAHWTRVIYRYHCSRCGEIKYPE